MSETSKGEHGPESGHQSVAEIMGQNQAVIAEEGKAIEGLQGQIKGLQGQIEGLQGQIEGLQGQIAEITKQVRERQGAIYRAQGEIAQPKYYHDTLVRFISELRKGEAGLWGYDNIVDGMFTAGENPGIGLNVCPNLTDSQKDEIVQSVLAETDLTEQEARELVVKQAEKNRAERQQEDKGSRFQE